MCCVSEYVDNVSRYARVPHGNLAIRTVDSNNVTVAEDFNFLGTFGFHFSYVPAVDVWVVLVVRAGDDARKVVVMEEGSEAEVAEWMWSLPRDMRNW